MLSMNPQHPELSARLPTLALELPARTMVGSSLREALTLQSRQIYQSESNVVNELRGLSSSIFFWLIKRGISHIYEFY